jgi:diguanylate cyclase (GGDEF)-like protein
MMEWSKQDQGACVLIADDDDTIRMLLSESLAIQNFEVHCAKDGGEAVEMYQSINPDIVLLDVDMPIADGFDVCRTIRKFDTDKYVPIVMITGLEDLGSIQRSYQCGADDFITKPISWPILGHRLFYLLKGARAFREVSLQQKREKAFLSSIPDAIIRFNCDGHLIDLHPGKLNFMLDGIHSHIGSHISELPTNDLTSLFLSQFQYYQQQKSFSCIESKLLNNDGVDLHIRSTIRRSSHDEFIFRVIDISEERDQFDKISSLSNQDQLTGLFNRSYFETYVSDLSQYLDTSKSSFAVIKCNICNFSRINQAYGLKLGDQVLRELAKKFSSVATEVFLGYEYCIARYAGDEFVIAVSNFEARPQLELFAQKLQSLFEYSFKVMNQTIFLQIAIGISAIEQGDTSTNLLEQADSAVKFARLLNEDKTVFFSDEHLQASVRQANISTKLHDALDRKEFYLMYQPKIDSTSGLCVSCEALLRWQNNELGLVACPEFIPIAEESRDIIAIGQWIIQEAFSFCKQINANSDNPIQVAINLSPMQLSDCDSLVKCIVFEQMKHSIDPSWIEFEITEYALISSFDDALRSLNQLKRLGFSIAIDDFGTGYSSLNYLTRFPIDVLKIDRSFVIGLVDEKFQKLVKAIVVMAHNLGLKVVAEGVETQQQLDMMKTFKCDYIQGYLYSKPLLSSEINIYIMNHQESETCGTQ